MGYLVYYYPPTQEKSWLDRALTFFYTAGHWLGQLIVGLVNTVVPGLIPQDLIDPIGYLALLTIIIVLIGIFEALRRAMYWIVGLGWLLIVVRIVIDKLS